MLNTIVGRLLARLRRATPAPAATTSPMAGCRDSCCRRGRGLPRRKATAACTFGDWTFRECDRLVDFVNLTTGDYIQYYGCVEQVSSVDLTDIDVFTVVTDHAVMTVPWPMLKHPDYQQIEVWDTRPEPLADDADHHA
ncbi:hypothetical protein [Kutzneria buriramensis]|uniref:Uncharacterized protein n=1 Tax=Kutzneria buriramensis TaxID=1045776 RepID=A0A3E0G892_9PSEU|nr:hypothetical protein [Kutzneria buriramensis]REH18074.1 hypothetical protein BCF44_13861 [Kutzneria buriramensis]